LGNGRVGKIKIKMAWDGKCWRRANIEEIFALLKLRARPCENGTLLSSLKYNITLLK